jgi:hypothetical protein
MANQVTDNRTDIADGTTVSGWEDIGGTALAVDTDIRYGTFTGSIGQYATTTRDATMYNNAATGLFTSGDVAYLLFNCGVVSLLDTKALGGLTVRVTGAAITDWAEFELFGSDEWPVTISGGWAQIAVDIDQLLASPTNTNGTPPTVANIQRFGITFICATVMPRMTDNIWTGGFRILPSATPAIIIEGRDSGTTDWNWTSVAAVAAVQQSAVLVPGPGGSFVCRGPIQFGINDTSTHAFDETNKTLLFDFQEVMVDGFYGLSALGNAGGTTNVTFGIKTGTGVDAVGAQGGSIQAASVAARWNMDFDDPNIDGANFYGVVFVHGDDFQLDDVAVDVVSTLYIDVTLVAASNSSQVRIQAIAPNTADGVAFMTTDDLGDIAYSTFEFSDGHAIEILTGGPSTQGFVGNVFVGAYGAIGTNDAALYNNAAAARTVNISGGGSTPTYRNGTSASTTIVAAVSVTFDKMRDDTEVRVYNNATGVEIDGIEDVTAGTINDRSFTWSSPAGTIVDYVIHHWSGAAPFYQTIRVNEFEVPTANVTLDINQLVNRNAS